MELQPPDAHHLRAAIGWLELGNHVEAGEELARLSPENLNHPEVLDLRWTVCAKGESWAAAAEVGETQVRVAPQVMGGWVNRAYATRRMPGGGLEKAEALLLPALEMFPKEFLIPYNLACYAAQLGRLDLAWERLSLAMSIEANPARIRHMALRDTDLEPLWERLRQSVR